MKNYWIAALAFLLFGLGVQIWFAHEQGKCADIARLISTADYLESRWHPRKGCEFRIVMPWRGMDK